MTLIASKRLQQGVFEALASSNRSAGSGGGSGLVPGILLQQATGAINQTITGVGAVDVTSSSGSFALGRTAFVWIQAYIWETNNGGGANFYIDIILDGIVDGSPLGLAARTIAGSTCPYTQQASIWTGMLGPGTHTVKLQGFCGNAGTSGTISQANYFVFQQS